MNNTLLSFYELNNITLFGLKEIADSKDTKLFNISDIQTFYISFYYDKNIEYIESSNLLDLYEQFNSYILQANANEFEFIKFSFRIKFLDYKYGYQKMMSVRKLRNKY